MNEFARLSARHCPDSVRPAWGTRIAHLGLGAFHRAHQAIYTEDAMIASGDFSWGICGVTQRSARMAEVLRPQDFRYTVVERGAAAAAPRVVAALREVIDGAGNPRDVVALLSSPDIDVITVTVTEKGYRFDSHGDLDTQDPQIHRDIGGGVPATMVGQLASGLRARAAVNAPVTVISCDNLPGNGRLLRRLIQQFCLQRGDERTAEWMGAGVRFPDSMVDRIVPATTGADIAEVAADVGFWDEAAVTCEPYRQWVIADDFAADRPPWELAGVRFGEDVAAWERLKLRVLNSSHSMLAYFGLACGYDTIARAVNDEVLAAFCRRFIATEVTATITGPAGVDVVAYGDSVLTRFANPALRHRTAQVASDGSRKLPARLLETVRERSAAGADAPLAAAAVAAWMLHVTMSDTLDDPLAETLSRAAEDRDPAGALLNLSTVFGPDLAGDPRFARSVRQAFAQIRQRGVRAALQDIMGG